MNAVHILLARLFLSVVVLVGLMLIALPLLGVRAASGQHHPRQGGWGEQRYVRRHLGHSLRAVVCFDNGGHLGR